MKKKRTTNNVATLKSPDFKMPPLPQTGMDLLIGMIARKAVENIRARQAAERAALGDKKAG